MADEKGSYSYSSYIPQGLLNLFTSGREQTKSDHDGAAAEKAPTQHNAQRKGGWFAPGGSEEDSDIESNGDCEESVSEDYTSEQDEGNEELDVDEKEAVSDCAESEIAKEQGFPTKDHPQPDQTSQINSHQYLAFVTEEGESSRQESRTEDISAQEESTPRLRRGSRATRKSLELWQTVPRERISTLSPSSSRLGRILSESGQFSNNGRKNSLLAPEKDTESYGDDYCCDACGKCEEDEAYCNVCQCTFCPTCWAMQIAHRKNHLAPGNVPHEKTSRELAIKIKNILEPDLSGALDEELHTQDESTTWFGIIREEGELPIFQDYGRYATLMSDTGPQGNLEHHDTRYPGLVSFVGQTGAGKSTLIKLVIDLSTAEAGSFATPVVGSVKNQEVPTSGDVHLYPDPSSVSSVFPILYADCEGLEGGEREPISSKFKKQKQRFAGVGRVSSFEKKTAKTRHTSERELLWANTTAKRSREFAVTHLYPRLLYTFSDVVVFVLKNPRTIESVFEKLVDWAAAALEKSSNQPVLPHAIIVLNASENSTEPHLWDPDTATKSLLQSLSGTIMKNDKFKKYAHFWKERQRQVNTVEELLLSYYSSIKVLRIPTHGRPNLIAEQVFKLYRCIQDSCTTARLLKGGLRMLLDADELQPYLQFAFDHFAYDLDTPFDFVQASFVNSPIPLDFGGIF